MSLNYEDKESLVKAVLEYDTMLKEIVEALSDASRRNRQNASAILFDVAAADASKVVPFIPEIVDALNRPEAQTRWECLEILGMLVDVAPAQCEGGLPGAETGLFDEKSVALRLSSMRFLCKFGAASRENSKKVWSLIDEGIQCYHGDIEFMDMLQAVVAFSKGALDDEVKQALKARMQFDADNSKGALQRRATEIIANLA